SAPSLLLPPASAKTPSAPAPPPSAPPPAARHTPALPTSPTLKNQTRRNEIASTHPRPRTRTTSPSLPADASRSRASPPHLWVSPSSLTYRSHMPPAPAALPVSDSHLTSGSICLALLLYPDRSAQCCQSSPVPTHAS